MTNILKDLWTFLNRPIQPFVSRTVTVRSGDTLSGIAQDRLGAASRWREIYDLNRDQLNDPDKIQPGQVLKLPNW